MDDESGDESNTAPAPSRRAIREKREQSIPDLASPRVFHHVTESAATQGQATPRNVLVTGATGYVGSRLVARLKREGWRVRALVEPGAEANLPDRGSIEVFTATLDDEPALVEAIDGADTIFHLAGIKDRSNARLWQVNVGGTQKLMNACAASPRRRRIVYLSSVAGYRHLLGPPGMWPLDEGSAVHAGNASRHEASVYGASKMAAERIITESAAERRIEFVIFRAGLCYSSDAPWVTQRVRLVLAGKKGWGKWLRGPAFDLLHVADLIEPLVWAAIDERARNEIINLVGEFVPDLDALDATIRALAEQRGPPPDLGGEAYPVMGSGPRTVDISKAHRMFGFAPRPILRAELADAVLAERARSSFSPHLRSTSRSEEGAISIPAGGPSPRRTARLDGDFTGADAAVGSSAREGLETCPPRRVKVGLVLPLTEGRVASATPRWSGLLSMARMAEQVGFDSLWVTDHLLFRLDEGAASRQVGAWECWSVLAGLAAATHRVELGTLVLCTAFRNPALLAKMVDTVDEMSSGRLILGLGSGYHEAEFRAFGYAYERRVDRFEEALTITTRLLREGRVDFDGKYHSARECALRPRGPRPQGPPILIGAKGQRMLALTARFADLWNAWLVFGPRRPEDEWSRRNSEVDVACNEAGRDPTTLGRTVTVMAAPATMGEARRRETRHGHHVLSGSPDGIAERLEYLIAAGASQIQVFLNPLAEAQIGEFARVLEELDRTAVVESGVPRASRRS